MKRTHDYVLALHPSSRGFGWILFEGPSSPFDWGTAHIRGEKNAQSLQAIEVLLDRYHPSVLVLEVFDTASSRRAPRIRDLCEGAILQAEARSIRACLYSREQIHAVLGGNGTHTRHGIAVMIADHLGMLRYRLPPPRKVWAGEHPSLALFSAAACGLAFYAAAG